MSAFDAVDCRKCRMPHVGALVPGCAAFEIDGDVDLDDFAALQVVVNHI